MLTRLSRPWCYRMLYAAGALVSMALFPNAAFSQTCSQTLSAGANLSTAISNAAAGSTICLNAGTYGAATISGVTKNPRVTIRSTSNRDASVDLTFQSGANGFTVDSVTVRASLIAGSTTKNITFQNSTFTGDALFDQLANSNVLFDSNTHNGIEGGGWFTAPARLHLAYSGTTHSGVTIQNSVMDGGSADGVQTGTGVNIINNTVKNNQIG